MLKLLCYGFEAVMPKTNEIRIWQCATGILWGGKYISIWCIMDVRKDSAINYMLTENDIIVHTKSMTTSKSTKNEQVL